LPSLTGATTEPTYPTGPSSPLSPSGPATEADTADAPLASPFVVPGDDDPDERPAPTLDHQQSALRNDPPSDPLSGPAELDQAQPELTKDQSGKGQSDKASRTGMFSALRIRNYRYFFLGQVVSNSGTWIQRVAQDWLVLSITGSAFAVGITTAMQFLPMLLFGLYGGVLSDRFPKRKLLIATQGAMGVLAAVLAVLTLIGPAIAGGLMAAFGTGCAFAINAASFGAVILGLLAMRGSELHPYPKQRREKGQLRAGLHYVAGRPDLIWPIVLVGFIGTFGFNFAIILSAFAYHVFHVGPGLYGLLNTSMAVGSLAGALLAARRARPRLRLLVGAALAFGVLETVAGFAPGYWVFAALLTLVGMFGLTLNTAANSLIQLRTTPAMRGRVMSLYMMVFTGGTPLGAPLVGWITEQYGPRIGLLVCGGVSAIAAAAIGVVIARIGNLRVSLNLQRGPEQRLIALVPRQA